jgi:hypothetical protein
MPYLVHGRFDEDVRNELLLYDVHFILLMSAFASPLVKLFDPHVYLRLWEIMHVKKHDGPHSPFT